MQITLFWAIIPQALCDIQGQVHFTISKNACLQGHFYAAVNIAECTEYISDKVAKTCNARFTAFIIHENTNLCKHLNPLRL